ncbi:MAG: ABC transporter substrate-binding protein [Puniceicoccales bacterium]|jgi:polar amino acid transport system substrate-binding protein|nr:ABC transporter substrate-binding protein [Puniceicoccales bacterium]
MKKLLFAVIFFLQAALLCSAERNEIVLLTSADNPPYEFMRSGEVVGFDIDVAKIIAEKLGKTLVIRDMPFSSLIPALMSKQGDFAMAAITPTDARRENVDFSIPYQDNISAAVLVDGDEFSYMQNTNAMFPIALLEGKTVGVQLGTHHESDIRAANIPNIEIKRYDNIGTMIAEISNSANGNGTLYALIIGNAESHIMTKKNPKLCSFPLQFSDAFAIAFPKNSPLKAKINEILESLKETDRISDLEIKWDIAQ